MTLRTFIFICLALALLDRQNKKQVEQKQMPSFAIYRFSPAFYFFFLNQISLVMFARSQQSLSSTLKHFSGQNNIFIIS
jgi:hypothetical protein